MGSLHVLKGGSICFPKDKKVVKSTEYLEYMEAARIIEQARQEADRIVKEAREVYEKQMHKGYDDGLLEGKMSISQQMMDTVAGTLEYFGSVEEKVVDVVMTALKKIIGELDDNELVFRVVRNALNTARNQKQVTLRVSPDQVEWVKERLNDILAGFSNIRFIDVLADGRLNKGGCILETEIGVVDASVDVQLETISQSLLSSFVRKT